MFNLSFFRRKSAKNPFEGFVDFHSHILPGVDDGVREIEDSLQILDRYEEAGFSEVWLTPHIMEEVPNTPADLRLRLEALKSEYKGPLKLRLAAENMIDNLFLERLEQGDILPIGDTGDMLLVETSYFQPPLDLDHTFELIRAKGYTPLFAHPERYNYITDPKQYQRLVDMGVKLQLNLFSLVGHYGPYVRKKAEDLVKAGLYSYAGTDIHRPHQLANLDAKKYNSRAKSFISALYE